MTTFEEAEKSIREKYQKSGETFDMVIKRAWDFMESEQYNEAWNLSVDVSYLGEENHRDHWEQYLLLWQLFIKCDEGVMELQYCYQDAVRLAPEDVKIEYKNMYNKNWELFEKGRVDRCSWASTQPKEVCDRCGKEDEYGQ